MIAEKIKIVAYYTFKEILKSKVLLNVFFMGLGLMLVTYVATEFTYGVPHRITLDVGLGVLSLSSLAISLFLGVTLLSKEIDSRTVYMVVARPVPRYAFIMGKVIGLMGIQVINVILLTLTTFIITIILGGEFTPLIFWTIGFILLESLLLLLVVVMISLLANTILSTLLSIIILLLGHSIKDAQNLTLVKTQPFLQKLLDFYHFVLPGFYKFNLKDYVIYKASVPSSYLFATLSYGTIYSLFLCTIIIFLFNKKNLD